VIPPPLCVVVAEVLAWVIADPGEALADVDAELEALGFRTWRMGLEALAAWRVAPTLALVIGSADLDNVHAQHACLSLRENPLLAQVPVVVAMPEQRRPIADPALADHELVVRPLRPGELLSRIDRARAAAAATAQPVDVSLRAGDLRLDPRRRVAWVGPRPVALSAREFELVLFLARHPARVYSRAQLLHAVWGVRGAAVGGRAVDVLVRRVRAKLGDEHSHCIRTVRSVGYALNAPDTKPVVAMHGA
jgi:DNA-binding response OmpR family regulator